MRRPAEDDEPDVLTIFTFFIVIQPLLGWLIWLLDWVSLRR